MTKYRTKCVEIEAFRFQDLDAALYWLSKNADSSNYQPCVTPAGTQYIKFEVPEGQVKAYKGDWLVKLSNSKPIYPCNNVTFNEQYELMPALAKEGVPGPETEITRAGK